MKNLRFIYCLLFCFLITSFFIGFGSPVLANSELPNQVSVTLETPVYKNASLNSELFKNDTNVIYLAVGTKLNVDKDFKNDMFYKIDVYGIIETAVEGDFGYVLKSHTLDSSIKSPLKTLDPNAKVKNDNSQIYSYNHSTNKYEPIENLSLNKDTQVRILDGYDRKKTYTYISFLNEDKEIVSYYIETQNLEVTGVNYSVIVAIIVLISCVGIICALFGFNMKKKKAIK